MNKGSIFKKIQKRVLVSSVFSAAVVSIAAVICMLIMRGKVIDISGRLGSEAAIGSETALEVQMEESLLRLAQNKAAISEEKLASVSKMIRVISESATEVASNPARYGRKDVGFPDAANAGQTVAQLRLPEGVDYDSAAEEAGLLGNLSALLVSEQTAQDYVASVYIGSENGVSISADKDSDRKTNIFDPRRRGWYMEGKAADGLIWSDIFADYSGRGLVITCAMPFYGGDGEIMGVAGADMRQDVLRKIVVETQLGETGRAFISNEHGEMIISETIRIGEDGSVEGRALSELLPEETAARIIGGGEGIERVSVAGESFFVAYAPMKSLPWSLSVLMSVEEVIAPAISSEANIIAMANEATAGIDRMILITFGIFAAALMLILAGNTLMAKRMAAALAKPIIELSGGAKIIGAGNLNFRPDIKTGDELEELSDTLNTMLDNIHQISAEKERIGAELNVAANIQASMLPCIFPAFPNRPEFDIYASMLPAKEVGGDFYDFFLIDENKLAVVIADVSGKGVPAALFMVIAKTLIKNNAQNKTAPDKVFETVNNLLCENNEAGMFVTAFMGVLDIKTGLLTYVNAGHNPPLIKRAGGKWERLPTKAGFVLAGMEGIAYRQSEISLDPEDMLFMYTDGVTEAENPSKLLFGGARLLGTVNRDLELPLTELLAGIKAEIDIFADGAEQADDITMLAMKYIGRGVSAYNMKELIVEAKTENLDSLQDFIAAELEVSGCAMKQRTQIAIAVEEIFVNIAHYAYKPGTGAALIRISAGEELVIEFEDSGKPYNPLLADEPDITAGADGREVGGLGIFMVKNIMDTVEYRHEDNKNILVIKKTLS